MSRKTRSDSKLGNLPEATQRAIAAFDHEPLESIRARLAMPEDEGGFGVGEVSIAALSTFLRGWRTRLFRERLRDAAEVAQRSMGPEVSDAADDMDAAILAGLRAWVFDSIARGMLDAKDAKAIVGLILKGRQQELDSRKVQILERKAAAFDKASAVAVADNLTPEERLAKIREGLKI